MATLVFLHGCGGPSTESHWLAPLNARLTQLGYPALSADADDELLFPSYTVQADKEAVEPPVTVTPEKGEVLLGAQLDFAARQKELERFVRSHEDWRGGASLSPVAPLVVDPLADAVEFVGFPEVSRYLNDRSARFSVWQQLLAQLPAAGSVIVVAHSLGSVVTADVLRRLPRSVVVDLLVTVGSPLGFPRYRANAGLSPSSFPYRKVQRWLNVVAPLDGVCAGRGLSTALPQVIDLRADLSLSHAAAGYMSHPAVAAAIGYVAFDGEPKLKSADGGRAREPARRIHASWDPVLLQAAFALQVSNSLPKGRWTEKLRLDAARREVATRAVDDIAVRREARARRLDELRRIGAQPPAEELDDHPLADGRHPDHRSLVEEAASLLQGNWTDPELLPFAMGLMLHPLVAPFDVQADVARRQQALELTLNLIRTRRGNLADKTFAAQVRESVEWAKARLADGGFPWGTVLITSGVVVLAATGIGLAAAAPAGLAGAAVVTSTLATFGPGGMVGGMIALATLTGTGASLASLGVSTAWNEPDQVAEGNLANHSAHELAAADLDALTVTLTGMLAVVHAQRALSFESAEVRVRLILQNALDIARSELQVHETIAPGAPMTKRWTTKVTRLQRAVDASNAWGAAPAVARLELARKTIETGRPTDS
jgi:hypothetical protein